jgi:tetratricopeptide (TPR) repeat protein
MASDLTEGIRLAITPEERRRLQNVVVVNQQAQDLYLKGRFVFHLLVRSRMREACGLIEQAVDLEPKFAIAWASLARCYAFLGNYGVMSTEAVRPLIAQAASRAIAEDPTVVEAHIELALLRFLYEWDWRAARDGFEQAVRLSPNNSFARDRYARFLSAAGRTTEAVEQARRGVQSDPQSASMRGTLALMLFYSREYPEALQRSNEAITLEPSAAAHQTVRARTLAALSRYDEAIQAMQQAAEASAQPTLWSEVAQYYARSGRVAEALAILAKLPSIAGSDGVTQSEDAAFILAALGRNDEALQRLEQAVDARSPRILWLRVDPRVDALRQDPRFIVLLTRIGGLD